MLGRVLLDEEGIADSEEMGEWAAAALMSTERFGLVSSSLFLFFPCDEVLFSCSEKLTRGDRSPDSRVVWVGMSVPDVEGLDCGCSFGRAP
jgi:hypothetical protein